MNGNVFVRKSYEKKEIQSVKILLHRISTKYAQTNKTKWKKRNSICVYTQRSLLTFIPIQAHRVYRAAVTVLSSLYVFSILLCIEAVFDCFVLFRYGVLDSLHSHTQWNRARISLSLSPSN